MNRELISDYIRIFNSVPEEIIKDKEIQCFSSFGLISNTIKEQYENEFRQAVQSTVPNCTTFNNTFHRTFDNVKDKSQEDLWAQAAIHYFSTYGLEALGYESKFIYLPEEFSDIPELRKFYYLGSISRKDAEKQLMTMLQSGIAIADRTLDSIKRIVDYLGIYLQEDLIKNNDMKIILLADKQVIPDNGETCIKVIYYIMTHDPKLIKNKESKLYFKWVINQTRFPKNAVDFIYKVLSERKDEIASVFFRYKDYVVLLKKISPKIAHIVNQIRRKADTLWKPYKKTEFLSTKIFNDGIENVEELEKLNVFELVKIYNKLSYYAVSEKPYGAYLIRNGKIFVKEIEKVPKKTVNAIFASSQILAEIRRRFENKNVRIKTGDIDIAFPDSENSFIGNIPTCSSVSGIESASVIGVSWKNKEKQRVDLDLSIVSDGKKYGWNSDYYNDSKSFIYSGDMTSEGAEAFFIEKKQEALVYLNLFNVKDAEYDLFFEKISKDEFLEKKRKYIVDPNNITFSIKLFTDKIQTMVGLYAEDKFIFSNVSDGKSNVSSVSELKNSIQEIVKDKSKTCLKLKDIFQEASYDDYYEEGIKIYNFENSKSFSKSEIIELCSE